MYRPAVLIYTVHLVTYHALQVFENEIIIFPLLSDRISKFDIAQYEYCTRIIKFSLHVRISTVVLYSYNQVFTACSYVPIF